MCDPLNRSHCEQTLARYRPSAEQGLHTGSHSLPLSSLRKVISVRQKQTQHNTTSVSANEETCRRGPGPPCPVQSPRQLRPFFGSEKDWKRLVRKYQAKYQIFFHGVESTWLCRKDSPSTVTSRNFIWMRFQCMNILWEYFDRLLLKRRSPCTWEYGG